jgi:hypothetical protein
MPKVRREPCTSISIKLPICSCTPASIAEIPASSGDATDG